MKKLHLAIATHDLETCLADYSQRFGTQPEVVVPNQYALWRTDSTNVSVRVDTSVPAGTLRHLGWEDSAATEFTADTDANGIVWERFTYEQQQQEIHEAFGK